MNYINLLEDAVLSILPNLISRYVKPNQFARGSLGGRVGNQQAVSKIYMGKGIRIAQTILNKR